MLILKLSTFLRSASCCYSDLGCSEGECFLPCPSGSACFLSECVLSTVRPVFASQLWNCCSKAFKSKQRPTPTPTPNFITIRREFLCVWAKKCTTLKPVCDLEWTHWVEVFSAEHRGACTWAAIDAVRPTVILQQQLTMSVRVSMSMCVCVRACVCICVCVRDVFTAISDLCDWNT